jgi:hypothetical protein
MFRWEGELVRLRYDGTETLLYADRWELQKGLSLEELQDLIARLNDALVERRAHAKSVATLELTRRKR